MAVNESKWNSDLYTVSALNWEEEAREAVDARSEIRIYDCTLREIEQSPHIVLKPDEKFELGKALDRLGVYSMQIFPRTSQADAEVMKALSQEKLHAKLTALCRWNESDVELAKECGASEVRVEGPANPWFFENYMGLDEDKLLDRMVEIGKYAQNLGLDIAVGGWDASRTPLSFLEKMYKRLAEINPTRIQVPDTYGVMLPWTSTWLFKKIRSWIGDKVDIGIHAHNDFGMALPCSLSAVAGGAAYVEAVMCGYGERSGNCPLEEIALALEVLMGIHTGIDLSRITYTAELVQELAKMPMPQNKPVIGAAEYIIYSGLQVDIHDVIEKKLGSAKGMFPFEPELVGHGPLEILMGKMSGSGSVKHKLAEWNLTADDAQIRKITSRIKQESMLRKWSLTDEQAKRIAEEMLKP